MARMPMKVTYEVEYPIVLSFRDYHEFNIVAEAMSKLVDTKITYTEIGFDNEYYAAFHPDSLILDNEDMQRLRNEYQLEAE